MRRTLLLAALVLGALAGCSDDDAPSPSAAAVERRDATGDLGIGSPPTTYRITYDVELVTADRREVEVVEGRPPFDVRVERSEDDELIELRIATFGSLETGGPEEDRAALVADLGVPELAPVVTGDVGLLLEQEVIEDLGQAATVLDRDCRFVRVEEDDGHRDLCVDATGLVLHEESVQDDHVVSRRTATEVEIDVRFEDDAFAPLGERLPEQLGGGGVRRMTAESRFPDVDLWTLDDVPAGMRFLGRYVVASDAEVDAQGVPGPRSVSLADAFEGHGEMVVVENVRSTSSSLPGLATDVGVPWEVDGFDDVRLVLSLGQSELRTANVRVVGTGSVDALVEVFESLVLSNEPGEAVPFDEDVLDVLDDPPA